MWIWAWGTIGWKHIKKRIKIASLLEPRTKTKVLIIPKQI